jgi:ubiquinone/menaquinone biosynthesis C-methylase UbiE
MKNRYLDVAMGTGQLLLNIAPLFNKSKGIDISDKMI